MAFLVVAVVAPVTAGRANAQGSQTGPGNPTLLKAIRDLQNSVNALQQPLAPSKASQLVTLKDHGQTCAAFGTRVDTQVLADATTQPFTIPAGRVLVITGIGLRTDLLSQASFTTQRFGLSLEVPGPVGTVANIVLEDQLLSGPTEGGTGKTSAVPNVVVKPGVRLCVFTVCPVGECIPAGPRPVFLYGFLADDE